jgi:hypothetical protein
VADVRLPTALYETTILAAVSAQTVAVTFAVLPARVLSTEQRGEVEGVAGLAAVLGGRPDDAIPLPNAWSLAAALALMLDPAFAPRAGNEDERLASWARLRDDAQAGVEFERFAEPAWWSAPGAPRPTPPAVAESLLLSAELPVEGDRGSLTGRSLASLLGAGGVELVVAVVAGAATPWLLISVSAGVIVARVDDGLGGGERDTIRQRLLQWLGPSGA